MKRWVIVNKATNKIEYAYKSDNKLQGDGTFPGPWDDVEVCDHVEMSEEVQDKTLNMLKVEAGEVKLDEAADVNEYLPPEPAAKKSKRKSKAK